MPADPCLVTVKAGPAYSKGYENFVSQNLKDEVLQEITSNLDESLKEEALDSFLETVKDGYTIKDCIFKVQNEVLPKVPKERNKFFIKFTYDNQLQIEIGVNKFKNGNAQFYHRLGVAPKKEQVRPQQKITNEGNQGQDIKRKHAMQELEGSGGFSNRYLKKQTTNDRSSPCISGKVSNPNGGWDDVMDYEVPPNPTNQQTRRALDGWKPNVPKQQTNFGPRALGDLFNKNETKPNQAKLRSRSAVRPSKERNPTVPSFKERSISPADVRHGRFRGALGDCFQTGLRPSQECLNPTASGSAVATPTIRHV